MISLSSTNANVSSADIAADLAAAKCGTFTGLIIRKVGEERGGIRYGDDLVHTVIVTGFRYIKLKERDLAKLTAVTSTDLDALVAKNYTGYDGRGAKATERALTRTDYEDALKELIESCDRTINGTNVATTDGVYEPLEVNGQIVRGCRVYTGNPGGVDAAPIGTIYLQGLAIGTKILDAAPNGQAPASKSGCKTIAKGVLTKFAALPSRRYVSYKLQVGTEFILAAGGQAAIAADAAGVTTDATLVSQIRDLLTA